ncbi:phosphoglycerate mutase [bacterium]|nr:phosphoglycerate mutase [bacterium]
MLLFVMDGVGDLPNDDGETPLSLAKTPHLDSLARGGSVGLHIPVAPGVAPGSGIAHLALFGYDPILHPIGRGIFEALGLGMELVPGDLAVRGNLATFQDGKVIDRRAGRIHDGAALGAMERLSQISGAEGCASKVVAGKGHRFALRLRGEGLGGPVDGNDLGRTGVVPTFPPVPPYGRRSRLVLSGWWDRAMDALRREKRANGVLLRGGDVLSRVETMWERHQITGRAIADYPCYRGVARLVGMEADPLPSHPDKRLCAAVEAPEDLIFFHHKATDQAGEDGDFEGKREAIEVGDSLLGLLLEKGSFDAVLVTGDHATPCILKTHSSDPVPYVLWGGDRKNGASRMTEAEGARGQFMRGMDLFPLLLARAGRLGTWLA